MRDWVDARLGANTPGGGDSAAGLAGSLGNLPQVQERLTGQIADALMSHLNPRGTIVVIEAEHLCMSMRGVRKPGALTVTSAVRGIFRNDPAARAEAMALMQPRSAARA